MRTGRGRLSTRRPRVRQELIHLVVGASRWLARRSVRERSIDGFSCRPLNRQGNCSVVRIFKAPEVLRSCKKISAKAMDKRKHALSARPWNLNSKRDRGRRPSVVSCRMRRKNADGTGRSGACQGACREVVRQPPTERRASPRQRGTSRARERSAGEIAADQAHVALRHPERVPDVARTVPIDVAELRATERRLSARTQTYVILRHEQGV